MTRVGDIMNRELFQFRLDDDLAKAPRYLLAFGITAAPVLDAGGAPLGVLSLRDCFDEKPSATTVGERMTRPAVTVSASATVEATARILAEGQLQHLVVVDAAGKAAGMVSTVDVLRALVGLPPRHPDAFPHDDRATGLTWTDDTPLEIERVEVAPEGPGVLLLVDCRAGGPRVRWGEWTHELRTRLVDLISLPQKEAQLSAILDAGPICFRAALLRDGPARDAAVDAVIALHVAPAPFISR